MKPLERECFMCGRRLSGSGTYVIDGNKVCENCYRKQNPDAFCHACGCGSYLYSWDGHKYCNSCYTIITEREQCGLCKQKLTSSEEKNLLPVLGRRFCDSCLSQIKEHKAEYDRERAFLITPQRKAMNSVRIPAKPSFMQRRWSDGTHSVPAQSFQMQEAILQPGRHETLTPGGKAIGIKAVSALSFDRASVEVRMTPQGKLMVMYGETLDRMNSGGWEKEIPEEAVIMNHGLVSAVDVPKLLTFLGSQLFWRLEDALKLVQGWLIPVQSTNQQKHDPGRAAEEVYEDMNNKKNDNMNQFYSPNAGPYRQPKPSGIERTVRLPSGDSTGVLWSDDYLFKRDGKWYEHHEGQFMSWPGHYDGGASTWERKDLDDEKVEALIREGKAGRL